MKDRTIIKSVCFGCTKRAAGCGATCEEFKAERQARAEEYDRRRKHCKVTGASIELREGRNRKR